MTFIDAASQSKTFTRAWRDLTDGFRRRELWLHLGWQDIKQKYRRSVLGPFWITIATGTTAIAMGALYSKLFKLELSEHLPYVTLGLIIWNMINASILEGADVFIANEGLIKQLPTPLSVHVYRLVWRQMILFAHNIVIFVVIAIIYPKPWSWADLTVIPALLLIMRGALVEDHRTQPAAALPRHPSCAVTGRPSGTQALGGRDHSDDPGMVRRSIGIAPVPSTSAVLGLMMPAKGLRHLTAQPGRPPCSGSGPNRKCRPVTSVGVIST